MKTRALALILAAGSASTLAVTTPPSNATNWNVTVLNQILASAPSDAKTVKLGDMEILVSNLQAWRDQQAGGTSQQLAFDGTAPIWTSGNVYYSFDSSVSAAKQKVFLDCAAEWATFANLHFFARTAQANYITILENPSLGGGQSAVGMIGGQQFLELGPYAWNHATVCHELGHALGLIHEHQRSDRDSFVVVLTTNILSGQEGNFVKLGNSLNQGAYDFLSVMHYNHKSFSVSSSLDTLQPLAAYTNFYSIMGQQFDPVLSVSDRAGMAAKYGAGPTLSAVVTNTFDSGPGSLRAALYYAYDHPGTTVTFNIPASDPGFASGVYTIQPTDNLPRLARATVLDGSSQPGNTNPNGPEIVLNGSICDSANVFVSGLRLKGTNCTVQSLIVNGFNNSGISISGIETSNNVVRGCYLGVNASGTSVVTNRNYPIEIFDSASANTVGGTTTAARNIISGSAYHGLVIRDSGTVSNIVQGNYIGLNAAGTSALPNAWAGIAIYGAAQANRIGGTASGAGNVISGNANQGIVIINTNSDNTVIVGNYIGVDPTGTLAISNGWSGIECSSEPRGTVIGGTAPGAGNLISGNGNFGVLLGGTSGTVVQGNIIGANASGTVAVPNGFSGIGIFNGAKSNLIGGNSVAARNLISGNNNHGVALGDANTANNSIFGNYIGVNATGTAALGNGWAGVGIFGGPQFTHVGSTLPGTGNVISGNGNQGVAIGYAGTANNFVQGNIIGLDAAGTSAIPNTWSGVDIFGASQNLVGGGPNARNFISGNLNFGVVISGSSTFQNSVQGNSIGLNISNNAVIANGFAGGYAAVGIYNGTQSNSIGGISFGLANLISGSANDGVQIADSGTTNNSVRGNSIFNSTYSAIGIYNGGNDNPTAPNLNNAVLTTNTTVSGTLNSTPNTTFFLDFYSDTALPGSAEAMTYLGSTPVNTSALGTLSFIVNLGVRVPMGRSISVTATDPFGNTSPLSFAVSVTATSTVNDGIPNAWRAAMFGGSGTTTNAQSCATCDPDGDGMNNLQEFLAGTNPTNNASRFALTALSSNSSNAVARATSLAGTVYRFESRDTLNSNIWTLLADQVVSTGTNVFVIDSNSTNLPMRFYRASVLW